MATVSVLTRKKLIAEIRAQLKRLPEHQRFVADGGTVRVMESDGSPTIIFLRLRKDDKTVEQAWDVREFTMNRGTPRQLVKQEFEFGLRDLESGMFLIEEK